MRRTRPAADRPGWLNSQMMQNCERAVVDRSGNQNTLYRNYAPIFITNIHSINLGRA